MKKVPTRGGGYVYIDPARVAMIATPKEPNGAPALGVCLVFLAGSPAPIIVDASASDLASRLGFSEGDDPKQLRFHGEPTPN